MAMPMASQTADYENVTSNTKNTMQTRTCTGLIVQRMVASDQEVRWTQGISAAVIDSFELANCLGPNEEVIVAIPCHGFDGFPDFGSGEHQ